VPNNEISRICQICDHGDREKMNQLLAQGADLNVIAETYEVKLNALRSHRDRHMRGIAVRTGTDAITIVRDLQRGVEQAEIVMTWAMENEKFDIALDAIKQHRESLVALSRITGADKQLDPRVILPHWDKIKHIILGVAEKFPEVGEDLMEAVNKVEENR
jgi:hypothetical protein